MRAAPIAALLTAASLLGCASEAVPPTQLMLVADTDIARLDHIEFVVSEGRRERRSDRLAVDVADAPFTMAVLREDGPLGPLIVSAIGYHGDALLVERSAVASFVAGETRTVVLHLVQSCMNIECRLGQTCTEHGCRAPDADAPKPWDGTAPRLDEPDAGMPPADAGPSLDATGSDGEAPDATGTDEDGGAPDAGDGSWMQCGSSTVDVNSDIGHCGGCGKVCRTAGAQSNNNLVAACIDGACDVACRHLWGDCDGDERNGCENWMSYDVENCGGCGLTCQPEEYCWLGECLVRQN